MAPGGVYEATPAELLHFMPQGVMKDMRTDIQEFLKLVWKGYRHKDGEDESGGEEWAIDTVEGRMRALPQFTDGLTKICHFHKGIFGLNWVSGEDHISMFQQMVKHMLHSIEKTTYLSNIISQHYISMTPRSRFHNIF